MGCKFATSPLPSATHLWDRSITPTVLVYDKEPTNGAHDQRDYLGIERFERAACEPAALLAGRAVPG